MQGIFMHMIRSRNLERKQKCNRCTSNWRFALDVFWVIKAVDIDTELTIKMDLSVHHLAG